MTITKIIELLEKLKDKHGDVEVYFDCPQCLQSFRPNVAVAVATHLTEKK